MQEDKVKQLVRGLVEVAMGGHGDRQSFVEEVLFRTHNTEQQQVIGLVYALIKGMARKDRFIDGRNQDAKDFCDKVVAAVPEAYFPLI